MLQRLRSHSCFVLRNYRKTHFLLLVVNRTNYKNHRIWNLQHKSLLNIPFLLLDTFFLPNPTLLYFFIDFVFISEPLELYILCIEKIKSLTSRFNAQR
jgi:hypothetical protein